MEQLEFKINYVDTFYEYMKVGILNNIFLTIHLITYPVIYIDVFIFEDNSRFWQYLFFGTGILVFVSAFYLAKGTLYCNSKLLINNKGISIIKKNDTAIFFSWNMVNEILYRDDNNYNYDVVNEYFVSFKMKDARTISEETIEVIFVREFSFKPEKKLKLFCEELQKIPAAKDIPIKDEHKNHNKRVP